MKMYAHFFSKKRNRPQSENLQKCFCATKHFFGGQLLTKTNYGNYEIILRSRYFCALVEIKFEENFINFLKNLKVKI